MAGLPNAPLFITVTDADFFPGACATVNSILLFHPDARICVINNHLQKEGLSAGQRQVFESQGVEVIDSSRLAKPGRKLSAWELKAYAAADLSFETDLLIGIDSDCVLCGPIHDVIGKAKETGKFIGGQDYCLEYGEEYRVYGIKSPARNEKYMSTSLYVCPINDANGRILQRWAECCNQAQFGGFDLYPGHGDQGVLNAILFAEKGDDGVLTLDNSLWSQHHCYWSDRLELRDGRLFNIRTGKPQRTLHTGGSEKFWLNGHWELLERHEDQSINFAWFLALLWHGQCHVRPEHFDEERLQFVDFAKRFQKDVERFLPLAGMRDAGA